MSSGNHTGGWIVIPTSATYFQQEQVNFLTLEWKRSAIDKVRTLIDFQQFLKIPG